MKANQQALRNDDDAQVGIGTMIVFIATILVAAVAAGVLINVSGGLQSKAVATGSDATENVASNLMVQSVYGNDFDTDGDIDYAEVYLTLGAGSEPIDLSEVIIQFSDGTSLLQVTGTATQVRPAGAPTDTILSSGDYFQLEFDLDGGAADTSLAWGESVSINIELIPEVGNSGFVSFTTPSSFGGAAYVQLF